VNMIELMIRIFYAVKPLIPRWFQIFVRRRAVAVRRPFYNHVWPIDKSAATPPPGWKGWPEGRRFAMVITHDVETLRGFHRCDQLMNLDLDYGFTSSFNFVPERQYHLTEGMRRTFSNKGFEIGVHDLAHNRELLCSRAHFEKGAQRINQYLHDWKAVGFRSGSMHRNLAWFHALDVEYDASTFDTDPFEPQPEGLCTIFPKMILKPDGSAGYVELPYTLAQDFTLFVIMRQTNIDLWRRKLDWIAEKGGMAMVIVHPDYINFDRGRGGPEEYPVRHYTELLKYIQTAFQGEYWNALPRDVASFFRQERADNGLFSETAITKAS